VVPPAVAPQGELPPTVDVPVLRAAVLAWFDRQGRRLGFRSLGGDPWAVLVSEVMAQQTQIARVDERLGPFLAVFPTPAVMAAAAPADVVRAWRGLGYNRRAIGLHRAAVAMEAAGGSVPSDVAALEALPGVGPYTARAVAAIAFGRPVGAVDVNVRRVVGRVIAGDPAGLAPRSLQAAADRLVDPARPGDWTHALMDLGATTCRPVRPACPACPARPWCVAAARAAQPAVTSSAAPPRATAAEDRRSPRASAPQDRRSPRAVAVPFEQTTRWLRGRIVDTLRDAPTDLAVRIEGPLGAHSAEAIGAAVRALARDGLVEVDAAGLARLPRGLRVPGSAAAGGTGAGGASRAPGAPGAPVPAAEGAP
jgi:A/G-specific adenine glycosylase